jgi:hypothetical protein
MLLLQAQQHTSNTKTCQNRSAHMQHRISNHPCGLLRCLGVWRSIEYGCQTMQNAGTYAYAHHHSRTLAPASSTRMDSIRLRCVFSCASSVALLCFTASSVSMLLPPASLYLQQHRTHTAAHTGQYARVWPLQHTAAHNAVAHICCWACSNASAPHQL